MRYYAWCGHLNVMFLHHEFGCFFTHLDAFERSVGPPNTTKNGLNFRPEIGPESVKKQSHIHVSTV